MANIDVTELFALANRSRRWASTSISYSLVTSSYVPNYYSIEIIRDAFATNGQPADLDSVTPLQEDAFFAALNTWDDVANLTFQIAPLGTAGDIVLGRTPFTSPKPHDANAQAATFNLSYEKFPAADVFLRGDIWLSTRPAMENAYIVPGGVGYWSVVHEVGHALGLSGDKGLGASLWHGENNSVRYTVMSYNQLPQLAGNGPGGSNPAPNAPMLLDIAAIQYLYGANALTNYGAGSHYEFRTVGGWPVQAIWDAGGDHDIIDASTKSNNVGGDGDDHARAHLVDLWAR